MNRTNILQNAVKQVTDPLMLSALMKTQSPYTDNKTAESVTNFMRKHDKENINNSGKTTQSLPPVSDGFIKKQVFQP